MCPYRITIVGAGLTGSITACRLKRIFKDDVAITLLEKSRGAGGRMSTNRCSENPKLTCDLGAQYISASNQSYERHKCFYDELLDAHILKEFTGKIIGPNRFDKNATHFIAPSGISTVVKHFLKQSETQVQYNITVNKIDIVEDTKKLTISLKENNDNLETDAVIFTIPVPQLLQIQGSLQNSTKSNLPSLQKVEYSSRYAMGLYFPDNLPSEIPWTCKYISEDDCLRFISVDTAKRGFDSHHGSSIVVHTSVPFGIKYLEQDFAIVEPLIMSSLQKYLPELPLPASKKCQRWRYSQVHKAFPGKPGCLVLNESPSVIAGGDSFSESTFDGCIDSSTSIIEKLSENIKSRNSNL